MVAQIILISQRHIIDQSFDYKIPKEMEKIISVGMRVLVPFGIYNNTVEGIVVGIVQSSEFLQLKNIKSVIDTYPVCSSELLNLCVWMQRKYLCTFYSAFKLVVPPKMKIIVQEWLKYNPDTADDAALNELTPQQRRIVDIISENNGIIEYNHLCEISKNKNLRRSVNTLIDKNIITASEKLDESIKELTVRIPKLIIPHDEAYSIADGLYKKRAYVQANMLLYLADSEKLTTSELIGMSDGNYNALTRLVELGYVEIYSERKIREAYNKDNYITTAEYTPTPEQKPIIEHINNLIETDAREEILIRGVTGSGKTEVFLQTIKKCIDVGKRAIMLVPEISLTPQMVERFVSRFGEKVAVIHSGLSYGERFDQWTKIRNNEVDVVVGARSAVFAPLENIGLIIMDEEHENSYKSEISPRYHARDVAKFRAKYNNASLILASATPAVDSFYRAQNGDYKLFEMNKRYNNNSLPDVKIVDMRSELFDYHNFSSISNRLKFEIEKNLENKEKTILFLNRRGYNTFVSCRECGYVSECKNCSIPLTYHKYADNLVCHYCGYTINNLTICPECGSKHVKFFGTGTQKIEDELKKLFPEARILRMDRDTTSTKGSHENILSSFRNNEADILLGTQMVTKGLDFASVTLVGVLAADSSLGVDDFRANEKTFSLLTQVCGRAGRGDLPGRAIIQTYQPKNSTIEFAKAQNYIAFYKNEINFRKRLNYPPFCDIISIMVQGENETVVKSELDNVHSFIKETESRNTSILSITPPLPAPITKIKGNYRYRILIKSKNADLFLGTLKSINNEHNRTNSRTTLIIDVNPVNMN